MEELTTRRRLPRSRRAVLLAVLTAAALAVTGCTGAPGPDGGGSSVSVAILEPDHLTPPRTPGGAAVAVLHALYAPLTAVTADFQIENVHAESVTSDDQKVWTVTLKPGWTFQDGEPITAQHYVDTINYAAYGPNGWGSNYFLQGVEGYAELNPAEGEPTATELSGLKVIDDLTFEITLSTPNGDLPWIMAFSASPYFALPSVAWEDLDAFNEQPVGSGPFMMDGPWEHNTQITVKRWDDYQGTHPELESIEFKIYQNGDAAFTDFQAGAVDVVGFSTDVPVGQLATLRDTYGDRVTVLPELTIKWLAFPADDPRLADVRVRQAISMAIDREGISQIVYGGLYQAPTGFSPAGFIGGASDRCGEYCEYDPEAAADLLAEAGGFEGDLVILYAEGSTAGPYIEAIANSVRQALGIEVVPKSFPNFGAFFEAASSPDEQGLIDGGFGAAIPTQANFFNAIFSSTSPFIALGGGVKDDEIDESLLVTTGGATEEERVQAGRDVEDRVFELMLATPVSWSGLVLVRSERLENFVPRMGGYGFDYATLTVSE